MHRMRFPAAVALGLTTVASVAVVVGPSATALPRSAGATDGVSFVAAAKAGGAVVRVGSFNVKNVVFDRHAKKAWPKRRTAIVWQVLKNHVGVLGIQEAQNTAVGVFRQGWNQYLDLRRALNRAGGHYRLTSRAAVDCKNPVTPWRCRYQDRGASRSTRILYDASLFTKVDRGAIRYRHQVAGEAQYLAWGLFRTKSTGQRFLFATTHITSRSNKVKTQQWQQMIRGLRRLSQGGRIPVLATGDMNASKYNHVTKQMLPAMKSAGFGDILDQRYLKARIDTARARRVVRAWISTYNQGQARVSAFGHEEDHSLGAGDLDYIFASNRLPVLQWKQVVNFNRRTLAVRDPRPSDHNLITAQVVLPRR